MPDEDKNFGGSLVLDFRKWKRHLQAKNTDLRVLLASYTVAMVTYCVKKKNDNNTYTNAWAGFDTRIVAWTDKWWTLWPIKI